MWVHVLTVSTFEFKLFQNMENPYCWHIQKTNEVIAGKMMEQEDPKLTLSQGYKSITLTSV